MSQLHVLFKTWLFIQWFVIIYNIIYVSLYTPKQPEFKINQNTSDWLRTIGINKFIRLQLFCIWLDG
jgi:hypothetical protein